jgi:acetyl-CoA synthetase
MASESDMPVGEQLDRELAELLEVEQFAPPHEFRERALLKDPAIYEQAAQDPEGWWARQAEQLHWFSGWDTVLDDRNPPFYKWFVGGTLNASFNCLDRHVEAGIEGD